MAYSKQILKEGEQRMIASYYLILAIAQSYDSITTTTVPVESYAICMKAGQQAIKDLHKNNVTSVQFSCIKTGNN